MTAAMSKPPTNKVNALPPVDSLVPGHDPVQLVAYYPEFAAYYPGCEPDSKAFVAERLPRDAVVIDAGANVGIYSILAGRTATAGHVHAFEPTTTADMLEANIAASGVSNIAVHRQALGRDAGRIDDAIYRVWGQAPEQQTYDFTTVDRFVDEQDLTRVDLIKIDVDGFDLEVLEGARATLERYDPVLMIEVNHALATRGRHAVEVYELLTDWGYTDVLVLDRDNVITRRRGGIGLEDRPRPTLHLHLGDRP